ncbi:hypothetical protein CPB97_009851 [Podila verticillata]|nr:hypothetical protein CPB97_009851 [Podila verticillata]
MQGRPVGPPHEELLVYWSDTKTTFGNVNYLKDKRDSRVLFDTEENNEVPLQVKYSHYPYELTVAATVRYLEMELPTRNAALKTNLDLVNKQLSKRQLSYVTLEDETMA